MHFLNLHKSLAKEIVFCIGLLLLALIGSLGNTAHAQSVAGAVGLKVDPSFPEPESVAKVTLDAYTLRTDGATIRWYVNDVEQVAYLNERSIEIRVGEIGETVVVVAKVTRVEGGAFTVKRAITPIGVDVVIEAETYVPPFYRGRALGGAQSDIRIIAIPQVGKNVNPANLSYRWQTTDGLLFGGPIKGKQAITLTVSPFTGNFVTVTILDENGDAIGSKRIPYGSVNSELYFYEENPLRGLNEIAIKESLPLVGDETTIHGEPYYLSKDTTAPFMDFEWRINGTVVENTNQDQHTITLRKSGNSGSAQIGFQALAKTTLPRYVKNSFNISF